ncbi:DNA-binding response regulator, OmpR family, contains REC and winged-helix (wHTH) domain [Pedococcus dokdonensis]|uniref:DNA-binding response regulator, OmpR family, contains REC and winged-helix (WHTH) domain n=1 Tax=Pedococcus dokdonensis TaxID=443156 RepID=A0A1H0TRC1_9MICO|nr:response regulator transcription factor [Pedococcus dokdonensis]SDP56335.1 DNA-binding response regulator, OmpR family, contains REC and winged-helix (wHTH) domain [Pedococcus dokdonensis]
MSPPAQTAVVVEDDPDIRELIAASLGKKGLEVHVAESGREGLEMVAEVRPDLVTLDLGLPDLDGIEVCRRVREVSDAYIVMISARTDEIDRLMGLEIGADDYLTKPFSPRELQARVTAMFRRPRAAPEPSATAGAAAPGPQPVEAPEASAAGSETVSLGRLTVDLESRAVAVDGDEVELTRTEFDLLATMVRAPRRVWGRDVLMRTVWGDGWAADEHLVEVHVGNMRRKLSRAAGSASFIRTVRGVGYRMEEPGSV